MCPVALNVRHAGSSEHAQWGGATAPLKNNNNNHYGRVGTERWLREDQHLWPLSLYLPQPNCCCFYRSLYIDGVELMNLASQSGDAGGSQLLFANFNQDNT